MSCPTGQEEEHMHLHHWATQQCNLHNNRHSQTTHGIEWVQYGTQSGSSLEPLHIHVRLTKTLVSVHRISQKSMRIQSLQLARSVSQTPKLRQQKSERQDLFLHKAATEIEFVDILLN